MIIVSNTGPLIGLAKVKRLDLLAKLATATYIPPQVHRELLAKIGPETEAINQALTGTIQERTPDQNVPEITGVLRRLDEGEREAVLLAHSFSPPVLLLMDDHAGRTAAQRVGLKVIGLAGLMLLAKENGFLNEVGPLIEQVRSNGYWLSDAVVNLVKTMADETTS